MSWQKHVALAALTPKAAKLLLVVGLTLVVVGVLPEAVAAPLCESFLSNPQ